MQTAWKGFTTAPCHPEAKLPLLDEKEIQIWL